MLHAAAEFFNSGDFMPHGHCFLWQPDVLWLHVLSDAGVAISYYAIPFLMLYFIRRRKDLPFKSVFLLFVAFIMLCGTTHLMSIWVIWHPDYAIEGVIKALTAIASVVTLFVLIKLMPLALTLQSPAQQSVQAHLRAVVDHALDGLISINGKGIIESFNPACERIFGYKAGEVIGQNIKMLMPEPYHSEHDGYLSRYNSTGEARIIGTAGREVSGRRKDGSIFPIDLSISAFMLEGEKHFSGILRDITERKHSDETKALLASIVTTSDDAIVSKTLDDVITSWNTGAERIFGFSASEAMGQHIDIIIPPDRQDEERKILAQLRSGVRIDHYETVRITKDKRRVYVLLTISPLYDSTGTIIGLSKIAHDITALKETEAERERYMKALERSNQELDDFAYIASHDLKEPLRGVFNHASFLIEDFEDKLGEEGVRRLHRLSALAQRMERLVNDLLYFSRLGRVDMSIQECDPNEIIDDIRQTMETFLSERNARIVVPKPMPRRVFDKTRVTEAFRNLITNAVKYNDKAERVVEVGFLEQVDTPKGQEQNVFYVKDNGIGIAPEFHEEIFRIFKRLQRDKDEKESGTGAGLTFVKKIIECHGGRIWLESEPGKGTCFYFILSARKI